MTAAAVIPFQSPAARAIAMVAAAVRSDATRRAYSGALQRFFQRYPVGPVDRATVQEYLTKLRRRRKGPVTINQALAALKKLAAEAAAQGYMELAEAQSIAAIESDPRRGIRAGNWLSLDQARELIAMPDPATLAGLRDRALFGLLLGGALRREEATELDWPGLQPLEGRLCIVDLVGKGQRVRTVPLPGWAVEAIEAWRAAGGQTGAVLRSLINGRPSGRLSGIGVWWIVSQYGKRLGVDLRPHDLRRTFGQLARKAGAPIDQIQCSYGHSSVGTTELYLNSRLNLERPPCDYVDW